MFGEGFRKIAVLTAILWLGGTGLACAQGARDLELNLKGERPAAPRVAPLAEFKISLDSQMLTPEDSRALQPSPAGAGRFELPPARSRPSSDQLVLRSPKFGETATPVKPRENGLRRPANGAPAGREFGSTLTLTPGYLESDRFGPNGGTRFISGSREGDRWRLYGEVGREQGIGFDGSPRTSMSLGDRPSQPRALASVRTRNGNDDAAGLTVSSPDQPRAFMLNNYYLEAMYRFRPAVQGKVSYEKSLVDSLQANENLQLEGIVDTSRDVTIKAGFRNQVTPEARQRRSVGDQKVWTEFILKF